jgi:hypothetical protein
MPGEGDAPPPSAAAIAVHAPPPSVHAGAAGHAPQHAPHGPVDYAGVARFQMSTPTHAAPPPAVSPPRDAGVGHFLTETLAGPSEVREATAADKAREREEQAARARAHARMHAHEGGAAAGSGGGVLTFIRDTLLGPSSSWQEGARDAVPLGMGAGGRANGSRGHLPGLAAQPWRHSATMQAAWRATAMAPNLYNNPVGPSIALVAGGTALPPAATRLTAAAAREQMHEVAAAGPGLAPPPAQPAADTAAPSGGSATFVVDTLLGPQPGQGAAAAAPITPDLDSDSGACCLACACMAARHSAGWLVVWAAHGW